MVDIDFIHHKPRGFIFGFVLVRQHIFIAISKSSFNTQYRGNAISIVNELVLERKHSCLQRFIRSTTVVKGSKALEIFRGCFIDIHNVLCYLLDAVVSGRQRERYTEIDYQGFNFQEKQEKRLLNHFLERSVGCWNENRTR